MQDKKCQEKESDDTLVDSREGFLAPVLAGRFGQVLKNKAVKDLSKFKIFRHFQS